MLAQAEGDWGRAAILCRESLLLARQTGVSWGVVGYLEGLAGAAAEQGQVRWAAGLYGAAAARRDAKGRGPCRPPSVPRTTAVWLQRARR